MHGSYGYIIAFFIIAGLAAVIFNGRKIMRANKIKSWPSIDATIFHQESNNISKAPDIFCTYQVNDKTYRKQIPPSPGQETMPGFAEHFKKQYPDSEKITIYYDITSPENMRFSVGAATEDKLILGLGVGTILMGLYAMTV